MSKNAYEIIINPSNTLIEKSTKDIYKTDSVICTKDIDSNYNEWASQSVESYADDLIDNYVLKIWE